VLALREAGFDYFFNSSKWWDFREPWALEQHEEVRRIAPSISFPETHDTARLAATAAATRRCSGSATPSRRPSRPG
jgi:starch synthase (maltosyl-transferring)